EAVFRQMLASPGIRLTLNSRIVAVDKDGARIRSVTTEEGRIFSADTFIDATYEGDILPLVHVSYAVGRENNAQYSETLNGVRKPTPYDANNVDPYVIAGVPASGLLPFVTAGPVGELGSADRHVQAYN